MATKIVIEPYRVTETGGLWRVSGTWNGERLRRHFSDPVEAELFCKAENDRSRIAPALQSMRTRLSADDIAAAESGVTRSAGRWPLGKIIDAGLATLDSEKPKTLLAPLATEWIGLTKDTFSKRWHNELRKRITYFIKANPRLTTDRLDRATIRAWLDGLDVAQQTKANYRNAVHRWCGWLVERGFYEVNPCSGIRIEGERRDADSRVEMPSVLDPVQAQAFMDAFLTAECRRLLGWATLCLFAGLRPESEASRATWSEADLDAGTIHVFGYKRGVKPRIMKLNETALAWLKIARADKSSKPGLYLRKVWRRAVEIANATLAEIGHDPITWNEDIQRHSYASYRAGSVSIDKLAEEMGTSTTMIYAHYRHPRTDTQVKAFWEIRPKHTV